MARADAGKGVKARVGKALEAQAQAQAQKARPPKAKPKALVRHEQRGGRR